MIATEFEKILKLLNQDYYKLCNMKVGISATFSVEFTKKVYTYFKKTHGMVK